MKMISLGEKPGSVSSGTVTGGDEEYFPSLYLSEKQIDALGVGSAKVGSEMAMLATIRVSSMSESKDGRKSLSFEIVEAGVGPKETKQDASTVLFPNG